MQPVSSVKSDVFVIQKYIERPLLISKRKFDIRLWVLVTHEHKCYYFKEGYIRMSAHKYNLNQPDNPFVHLTNNAIQKHGENYGAYEEGNILSFSQGSVSKLARQISDSPNSFHFIIQFCDYTFCNVYLNIERLDEGRQLGG